ncbi:unnamed protein product [Vitrella brassicaformis CCMP3155]|uniref:Uncharacterized protein n=3 Tax=Vitrella brassicaformis TaxID=1169539 RepID=A0A0G4EXF1_VITBC|nr:unnamed protein product [Vitrella brassicaformis CCMP3155]|eukprot:CEM03478.1 unnamed protein product [Vitrella brassicaformis CCMP3155]
MAMRRGAGWRHWTAYLHRRLAENAAKLKRARKIGPSGVELFRFVKITTEFSTLKALHLLEELGDWSRWELFLVLAMALQFEGVPITMDEAVLSDCQLFGHSSLPEAVAQLDVFGRLISVPGASQPADPPHLGIQIDDNADREDGYEQSVVVGCAEDDDNELLEEIERELEGGMTESDSGWTIAVHTDNQELRAWYKESEAGFEENPVGDFFIKGPLAEMEGIVDASSSYGGGGLYGRCKFTELMQLYLFHCGRTSPPPSSPTHSPAIAPHPPLPPIPPIPTTRSVCCRGKITCATLFPLFDFFVTQALPMKTRSILLDEQHIREAPHGSRRGERRQAFLLTSLALVGSGQSEQPAVVAVLDVVRLFKRLKDRVAHGRFLQAEPHAVRFALSFYRRHDAPQAADGKAGLRDLIDRLRELAGSSFETGDRCKHRVSG